MPRAGVWSSARVARCPSQLVAWALLVGLAVLGYFDFVPCPFAGLFHLPCPGCGLGRATRELLAGDVDAAIAFHPLAPVVVPLVALGLGWSLLADVGCICSHPAQRRTLLQGFVDGLSILLAALLVGVWLARFVGALGGPVAV